MEQRSLEYKWSLALRNALEQCGNHGYDLLVQGLNTSLGRAVIHQGGLNMIDSMIPR